MARITIGVALVGLLFVSSVAGHGWITEPLQRSMTSEEEDYSSGMLQQHACGTPDDEPVSARMEATIGDTVTVKWMKNHNTNDQDIIVRFGDFSKRDTIDPDDWEVLLDAPVYDDEQGDVEIPVVDATGVYSFQWYWEYNNRTYRSCGDILVNVPERGEEVPSERCPESCSDQGKCVGTEEAGVYECDCERGWKGEACDEEKSNAVLFAGLGIVGAVGVAVGYTKTQQAKAQTTPSWGANSASWADSKGAEMRSAGGLTQATDGTRGAYNSRRSAGSKNSGMRSKSSRSGRPSVGSKGPKSGGRSRSASKGSKGPRRRSAGSRGAKSGTRGKPMGK